MILFIVELPVVGASRAKYQFFSYSTPNNGVPTSTNVICRGQDSYDRGKIKENRPIRVKS